MLKSLWLILFATVLCLFAAGATFARSLRQGDECIVPADMVIEGALFTLCQNLIIAGRVEGNVIGIGLRSEISGDVGGNVYLAGLELDLNGTIGGDLHYAGVTMNLAPQARAAQRPVHGQIIFAALSAQIGESITVPGPITGLGYQLLLDAAVNGEISYWGSAFVLTSVVHGDVYAAVGNPATAATDLETLLLPLDIELAAVTPGLAIASSAAIQGDLEYVGPVEAEIGGSVQGSVTYHSTTPAIIPITPEHDLSRLFLEQFKREIAVLLTVGLLGTIIAPKQFRGPLSNLRRRPASGFVIGMLLFILSFPIALIMMLITAIIVLLLRLVLLVELIGGLYSEGYERLWQKQILDSFTLPTLGGLQLQPVAWYGLYQLVASVGVIGLTELLGRRVRLTRQGPAMRALLLLNLAIVAGIAVFSLTDSLALAALALLVLTATRAAAIPVSNAWLNQSAEPEIRATLFSLQGQVNSIGQVAGGPPAGLIGQRSLRAALLASGLVQTCSLPVLGLALRRAPAEAEEVD